MSKLDTVAPATKRKRVYNLRKIRATWPYTVQEIADLLGVHKNAVLRWFKEGLRANRDQRPYLIRGEGLIRFLSERQSRHRHKCSPTQFYCFRCRCPREPYLGIVDIVIENSRRLRLSALCSVCDTPVNKLQRVTDLPKIHARFHVQKIQGEHLIERIDPSLNSDLERDA
jgi:excisionase family DNA binding protein